MDKLSQKDRSIHMSRIRAKNTRPEIRVRSLLHKKGYRFRLHDSTLPGTPDIVLKKHNVVIFVNGCFWHRHNDCKRSFLPKSRTDYWLRKFELNIIRDKRIYETLNALGWRVAVVWECQTHDEKALHAALENIFTEHSG